MRDTGSGIRVSRCIGNSTVPRDQRWCYVCGGASALKSVTRPGRPISQLPFSLSYSIMKSHVRRPSGLPGAPKRSFLVLFHSSDYLIVSPLQPRQPSSDVAYIIYALLTRTHCICSQPCALVIDTDTSWVHCTTCNPGPVSFPAIGNHACIEATCDS